MSKTMTKIQLSLIAQALVDCDNRIDHLSNSLNSLEVLCKLEHIMKNADGPLNLDENINILNCKTKIKIIKIEKLIYQSEIKSKEVFDKLLEKYDTLLNLSYQYSEDLVKNGYMNESEHIDYCKDSLIYRNAVYAMGFAKNR